ncbi:MAG: hypothetical protein AAF939_20235 [Planctomycetota bacterium]
MLFLTALVGGYLAWSLPFEPSFEFGQYNPSSYVDEDGRTIHCYQVELKNRSFSPVWILANQFDQPVTTFCQNYTEPSDGLDLNRLTQFHDRWIRLPASGTLMLEIGAPTLQANCIAGLLVSDWRGRLKEYWSPPSIPPKHPAFP